MSEATNAGEAAMVTTPRGRRKALIGVVVSVKMNKTAVVSVERRRPHPLYRKIVRSTKRYKAHDPNNAAVLGDVVRIEETRPISKDKHWRIAATLTRGNVAEVAPRDIGAPEEALRTTLDTPMTVAEPVDEAPAAEVTTRAAEAVRPVEETGPAAAVEPGGAEPMGPDVAAETAAAEEETTAEAPEDGEAEEKQA